MINGLTMDDYPLSLTAVVERAERSTAARRSSPAAPTAASPAPPSGRAPGGRVGSPTALAGLGVGDGDRVATLLWNQPEHLEMYFAVPAMGAVIHTLNPRLHPDELGFIVGDAQDRVIVVDESLLDVFETFRHAHRVRARHRRRAHGRRPAEGRSTTRR